MRAGTTAYYTAQMKMILKDEELPKRLRDALIDAQVDDVTEPGDTRKQGRPFDCDHPLYQNDQTKLAAWRDAIEREIAGNRLRWTCNGVLAKCYAKEQDDLLDPETEIRLKNGIVAVYIPHMQFWSPRHPDGCGCDL